MTISNLIDELTVIANRFPGAGDIDVRTTEHLGYAGYIRTVRVAPADFAERWHLPPEKHNDRDLIVILE